MLAETQRARPFIKWAGGKGAILAQIVPILAPRAINSRASGRGAVQEILAIGKIES